MENHKSKSFCICSLSNIDYDSRTRNFYQSLRSQNYIVNVVAFDWLTKDFKTQLGEVSIYKLNKNFSSFLFYLKFSAILLKRLVNTKADIYLAEDIYTLPLTVIIAKIKRKKIFYDCRELFGFLAGLKDRKIIQTFIKYIEVFFIRFTDLVITTGEMDSEFITKKYSITKNIVIRNLPRYYKPNKPIDYHSLLNISEEKKILLYQGVILHGRGLKYIFEAIHEIDNIVLVVIGDGEYSTYYKNLANRMLIGEQVYFLGKVKQDEILRYTAGADIGLSIIENFSLSYYYALPNKLFEYIMSELPVIVSDLPQMEKIVKKFNVGFVVEESNSVALKKTLTKIFKSDNSLDEFKANCKSASEELNWENEIKNFLTILK